MIVAPSILSMDYSNMKEQTQLLNESKAEWMHFDVMDGHFVPNLTFGPDILKGFVKMSDLYMDVHLMVEDPTFFADVFMEAGANHITFHEEAFNHLEGEEKVQAIKALAKHVRDEGKTVGLSIKPKTDVSVLKQYLNDFDLFLIMSVEPGFGGQKFQEESVERIHTLRTWCNDANLKTWIQVDGGINETTCKKVKEAGANVVVAGSYVFKHDIKKAVETLV